MNAKMRSPIIAVLLAVAMILAGCSSAIPNQTTNQTNTTVDDAQSIIYVSTDLEQCKLIRYMCTDGKEPFTDANGCGCKPPVTFPTGNEPEETVFVATNMTVCAATTFICPQGKTMFFNESGCGCTGKLVEPQKTYCTPEQRNVPTTEEYRPVCAWFGEKVQCFAFPCAIAAENPSKACANPDVEYYTDGECPSDITQTKPALTSSQLMEPIDQNKACTMDYTPVCALFDDGNSVTIGNACGASNIKGVVSTTPGECSEQTPTQPKRVVMQCSQDYIDMQSEEGAICTKEYMPVCATDAADAQKTFGNKCMACTTPGVFEYTEGACNDGTGATI